MNAMEKLHIESFISNPCNILISAPSGGGKSTISYYIALYRDYIFKNKIEGLILCYSMTQQFYDKFLQIPGLKVVLHEGLPSYDQLKEWSKLFHDKHYCIIMDDLMTVMCSNEHIKYSESLFTKYSHHLNITLIVLTQSLFWGGSRTLSLNTYSFFC